MLGLNISNNLKWNYHISENVRKASTRLYFLIQLKRARIDEKDLLTFYTTCIRPIIEYASPVFHDGLPNYLSDDLERLQKRALRIISPSTTYAEALDICGLSSLQDRREHLTTKLFHEICCDPNHKLQYLLPDLNESAVNLRNKRKFRVPICKTNRLKNSFIYSNSNKQTF